MERELTYGFGGNLADVLLGDIQKSIENASLLTLSKAEIRNYVESSPLKSFFSFGLVDACIQHAATSSVMHPFAYEVPYESCDFSLSDILFASQVLSCDKYYFARIAYSNVIEIVSLAFNKKLVHLKWQCPYSVIDILWPSYDCGVIMRSRDRKKVAVLTTRVAYLLSRYKKIVSQKAPENL